MTKARNHTVVFLGGGRITGALLAGLRLAGYNRPIVVHDRHPQKLRQLRVQYDVETEPNLHRAVERAHLLIIAVRPDSVRELLLQIGQSQPGQTRPMIAVSLAAGIPLKNLHAWMGRPFHWARAMPSPVARSGRGLTAITFEHDFPAPARREIENLFSQVGRVLEIYEGKFDAFTVTYSPSHGYQALAALARAAQKLGLDRGTALTAAAHALADGIFAWRESGISLQELLREAATPGGIAAASMTKMDNLGYIRTIEHGLRAGMTRARKNAKR